MSKNCVICHTENSDEALSCLRCRAALPTLHSSWEVLGRDGGPLHENTYVGYIFMFGLVTSLIGSGFLVSPGMALAGGGLLLVGILVLLAVAPFSFRDLKRDGIPNAGDYVWITGIVGLVTSVPVFGEGNALGGSIGLYLMYAGAGVLLLGIFFVVVGYWLAPKLDQRRTPKAGPSSLPRPPPQVSGSSVGPPSSSQSPYLAHSSESTIPFGHKPPAPPPLESPLPPPPPGVRPLGPPVNFSQHHACLRCGEANGPASLFCHRCGLTLAQGV